MEKSIGAIETRIDEMRRHIEEVFDALEARVKELETALALLGHPAPACETGTSTENCPTGSRETQATWQITLVPSYFCPKCGRFLTGGVACTCGNKPTPPALDVEGVLREFAEWLRDKGFIRATSYDDAELAQNYLAAREEKP